MKYVIQSFMPVIRLLYVVTCLSRKAFFSSSDAYPNLNHFDVLDDSLNFKLS